MNDNLANNPIAIWRRLHWAFFVNTQGLFIALSRFEIALSREHLKTAKIELLSAATLMRAAGASMQLAGSFSHEQYAQDVRPSMMPPAMPNDNFSGLMSWDHASLIQLWRRLSPLFADLPETLEDAHAEFVKSYKVLAKSHAAVCAKFGGDTEGSIRYANKPAVGQLNAFAVKRREMLDPNKRTMRQGCPLELESES